MTEEGRTLSRRELREHEGWVSADAEASDDSHPVSEPIILLDPANVPETASIPIIGEDGQPLSRRQLRELWLAEAAAAEAVSVVDEEVRPEPEVTAEPEGAGKSDASFAEAAVLVQIDEEFVEDVELDTAPDTDDDVIDEIATDEKPVAAPKSTGFKFPWKRAGAAAAITAAASVAADSVEAAAAAHQSSQDAPESSDPVSDATQPVDAADSETVDAANETDLETRTEPETEVKAYTFPEVSPLPESRSIFDTQSTPTIGFTPSTSIESSEDSGAFDDLITRAVADEGAASSTNTAALILPVMPDTTDISGSLNETGEIFITGSIELPKSLGETGSHEALIDNLDAHEAAVLGHDVHEINMQPESTNEPVSAARAISALDSKNAIVSSAPPKNKKLPMVLAISAGSVIVVVAGVVVWAVSTGLFG